MTPAAASTPGTALVARIPARHQRDVLTHFPPRPALTSWPVTRLGQADARALLCGPLFVAAISGPDRRAAGVDLLLEWLSEQPGTTWQQRWMAAEPELGGMAWARARSAWLAGRDRPLSWHSDLLAVAMRLAISADLLRPSLGWLLSCPSGRGPLARVLAQTRDPVGFTALRVHCANDPDMSPKAQTRSLSFAAVILAARGGVLADITVGDVVELLDAEVLASPRGHRGGATLFYRMLRGSGILGDQAPPTVRHLRTVGQRTPAQLIDRYGLVCRPIRDLLVDYLTERQPALDYNSLAGMANALGNRFWADLEAHHPGIDSLHLPADVAVAWKQRLRTKTAKVTSPDGVTTQVVVERMSYRECLTPVRALYLDLAHWSVEDPTRWAWWVAPSPIGDSEIDLRKGTRQRKARMDTRTRARLPALPTLVAALSRRRRETDDLLHAAVPVAPGASFTRSGLTFTRQTWATGVWVRDPATGKRRDLAREEEHAFWAWATVEVLRATGIRIEELLELSHHSLVQYRLPGSGELIPLLQIAPSKTDAERLLVVSPDLAEVLSAIIRRVRGTTGAVPLVSAYDDYERTWLPPAPLLFQRRSNFEDRGFAYSSLLKLLTHAVKKAGMIDPIEGRALHYTPHDFRRMFITDAILNGLPPHIAQIIAGHRDINVTLGYKAIYPEEAIQAHLAFLARRRSLRPSEEYRVPTDDEWQEFLGHFERRKVSIGTCARAFATPCQHEHACVRCPMLMPDPAQHGRLIEIRDNLTARITEAEHEGWLGEIDGLQVSLAGAEQKLAQLSQHSRGNLVELGMPIR